MGLQKYRVDEIEGADENGAIRCYTRWIGGPTLALVRNCPTPFGPRTVYVRDEPDTYFSIPAACQYRGRTITGWLDCEDGAWTFHPHRGPYIETVYPFGA
jgi:hypothetical protein